MVSVVRAPQTGQISVDRNRAGGDPKDIDWFPMLTALPCNP